MRWLAPSDRTLRRLARGMQAAILAVLGVGLAAGNASVVLNALVAFAVTLLPAALRRDRRLALSPSLTVWPTAAVLLHAVGMLGPYGAIWWWDHLTHTLSAAVVASVAYVAARAVDLHLEELYLPPRFMALFLLLFTLALGVFWEVLEFGARALGEAVGAGPLLFQYGLGDTVVDLVFDAVGAVVVALFGTPALSDTVEQVRDRLRDASA